MNNIIIIIIYICMFAPTDSVFNFQLLFNLFPDSHINKYKSKNNYKDCDFDHWCMGIKINKIWEKKKLHHIVTQLKVLKYHRICKLNMWMGLILRIHWWINWTLKVIKSPKELIFKIIPFCASIYKIHHRFHF